MKPKKQKTTRGLKVISWPEAGLFFLVRDTGDSVNVIDSSTDRKKLEQKLRKGPTHARE